jgi:uncharacterized protein YaiE (UPF0345 family)
MNELNNVSVVTQANVYFDGKCVSHTVRSAEGKKITLGVILPATLLFNTELPERIEGVAGSCRIRLKDESQWSAYGAGETFNVPGNSSFDIEVSGEPYHYICHFG